MQLDDPVLSFNHLDLRPRPIELVAPSDIRGQHNLPASSYPYESAHLRSLAELRNSRFSAYRESKGCR